MCYLVLTPMSPLLDRVSSCGTTVHAQGCALTSAVRSPSQELEVGGSSWRMTCVSMGNPHAVTFSNSGGLLKVANVLLGNAYHAPKHDS